MLDVLIVLGSVRDEERNFRTYAGGLALKNGLAKNLILSGGRTKKIVESESMLAFIVRKFPKLRKRSIILENTSIETSSNIRNSLVIASDKGFTKIGILTSKYHLKRAVSLAKSMGADVKAISVEEIFAKYDQKALSRFNKYLTTSDMKSIQNLEKFLNRLLGFDRKGRLPYILSRVYLRLIV